MEFKGTKGKWELKPMTNRVIVGDNIADVWGFDAHINVKANEEMKANALLISKAPCFYEDAKNDLDLFDELLRSIPLGLQHLKNAIKDRKKEKEKLIKQATEL